MVCDFKENSLLTNLEISEQNLVVSESTSNIEEPSVIVINELGEITQNDVILHSNQQYDEGISTATTLTYVESSSSSGNASDLSYKSDDKFSPEVISSFDLKEFLNSDIIGQALLSKNQFTNSDRDRLSEILTKHMINKHGRLNNDSLNILAKKIVEVFPTEKSCTYFIPPVPKCRSLKNISERSRGKLVDKQRNLFWLISTINKGEKSITKEKAIPTTENDEGILVFSYESICNEITI